MQTVESKRLKPIPRRDIKPILSQLERKSYQAAWRIVRDQPPASVNALALSTTRQSRAVDRVAAIIQEEMR